MQSRFLCGRWFTIRWQTGTAKKFAPMALGIFLQVQLYGSAKDLCKQIPDIKIRSLEGAQTIVDTLLKQDPLTVVSDVPQDFLSLLGTKRNHRESFKNSESDFRHSCPV